MFGNIFFCVSIIKNGSYFEYFFLGMLFGRRLFWGIRSKAVELACTEPFLS